MAQGEGPGFVLLTVVDWELHYNVKFQDQLLFIPHIHQT